MRSESLAFLISLANTPSPSGHEEEVAEIFREYVRPHADEVRTDIHGNVHAVLNPSAGTRIMLAGHMDEIGFIVHYINDDGLLYIKGIGGHDPAIALGQRVWVHANERIPGAIGRKAVHLLEDDDEKEKKPPQLTEVWVDIGVSSRAAAEKLVQPGDVVTFQQEFQMLEEDRALGRGFDNKTGAFAIAETTRLLKEDGGLHAEVGLHAVATVQEEVGFRGATTASYSVGATTGVAVDVSHATDYPGVDKERHGRLELGKGPAITKGAFINLHAFSTMIGAADDEGIPYQIEIAAECTGTDATAMQISRGGMATCVVGVPLRYMHTPCELLSLRDVENCARLLAAYCRRITPDTDFTPRRRGRRTYSPLTPQEQPSP